MFCFFFCFFTASRRRLQQMVWLLLWRYWKSVRRANILRKPVWLFLDDSISRVPPPPLSSDEQMKKLLWYKRWRSFVISMGEEVIVTTSDKEVVVIWAERWRVEWWRNWILIAIDQTNQATILMSAEVL